MECSSGIFTFSPFSQRSPFVLFRGPYLRDTMRRTLGRETLFKSAHLPYAPLERGSIKYRAYAFFFLLFSFVCAQNRTSLVIVTAILTDLWESLFARMVFPIQAEQHQFSHSGIILQSFERQHFSYRECQEPTDGCETCNLQCGTSASALSWREVFPGSALRPLREHRTSTQEQNRPTLTEITLQPLHYHNALDRERIAKYHIR